MAANPFANNPPDIFVARLKLDNSFAWARSAGGHGNDYASAIAIDGGGNATIVGSFEGWANYGPHALGAKGRVDAFVWRLPAD